MFIAYKNSVVSFPSQFCAIYQLAETRHYVCITLQMSSLANILRRILAFRSAL